jgi:TRAP-type C4-dicarboxylate transport system permease small subunit
MKRGLTTADPFNHSVIQSFAEGTPLAQSLTLRRKLDKILGNFLALLLGVMALNVLWQVFSRYVLKSPGSFTDELARYLLIWLGMLGAAYASGQGSHLSIDLRSEKLGERNKRRVSAVICFCIAAFALGVMVVGGARLVYITGKLNQTSAALGIPLAFVYAVVPLSGLLVLFYQVLDLQSLLGPKPDERRVEGG